MTELRDQLQASLGRAFTIERELVGGGMSRVFVATELALGRRVAIKVLSPELVSAVSAERFRREIQVVAQLQHPHIVPVHTTGIAVGLLFYTMPFVEGETLRQRLKRDDKLPVNESVGLLAKLAGALAYAHERGVVHRDIKPDNVLLSGAHAMLADFGVAKAVSAGAAEGALTSAGLVLGTPAYMAPEQIAAIPRRTRASTSTVWGSWRTRCWPVSRPSPRPHHRRYSPRTPRARRVHWPRIVPMRRTRSSRSSCGVSRRIPCSGRRRPRT